MNTYVFCQKNGNACVTLSENDEDAAWNALAELLQDNTFPWRLDIIETEEE